MVTTEAVNLATSPKKLVEDPVQWLDVLTVKLISYWDLDSAHQDCSTSQRYFKHAPTGRESQRRWVGDLFVSSKFTNILKQRKETESVFFISWLTDHVTWVLNKGSNIHLLLSLFRFFLSLRKQNISCQIKRNVQFFNIMQKNTHFSKIYFFSFSSHQEKNNMYT